MGMTAEEIQELDARAAWEDAQRAAQARMPPEAPTHSVDVNALPDAKEEIYGGGAIGQPPPPKGIVTRANELGTRVAKALPWVPNPSPNTEDTEDPQLKSRREAFITAEGKSAYPNDETSGSKGRVPQDASEEGAVSRGGGGGVLIPGGMGPDHETRTVKHGQVVAPGVRAALGEAGRLQMEAADIDRQAANELERHAHDAAMAKVHANESAAAQQQRLAEDRDRMVQARLAEIETLNKKAQGAPEDLWSAPHVFARVAGFLTMALGTFMVAKGGKGAAAGIPIAMSGQFINGLVNQDIQSKLDERNQAGKAAGRQINLLHLHEERMGNQAKAIEATRLAYYDNILQQMEAYKASHAGQVNEANYQGLQAQILKQQADTANGLGKQEQADVTDQLVNKYRPPQVLGGGGGGAPKDIPHQIRLADGTTYALPTEAIHKESLKHLTYIQEIQALDNEALNVRADLNKLNPVKDREQFLAKKGILERIGQDRLNVTSVAMDQGVVNASDRKAEDAHGTAITSGYDYVQSAGHGIPGYGDMTDSERRAADEGIRAEIKRKDDQQRRILAAANARVVTSGYNRDPATGALSPTASYQGKDTKPRPALAPAGSTPRDPAIKNYPTASAPDEETTPRARILSERPTDLPAPAAHHGKKK